MSEQSFNYKEFLGKDFAFSPVYKVDLYGSCASS